MRKILLALLAIPIIVTWGGIKSAYAWPEASYAAAGGERMLNLGANLRSVWSVAPGASLGAAAPASAAGAVGMYSRDGIAVLAEFGVSEGSAGNVAGLWCGYLYRNWLLPSVGLDSRSLFEVAGIGPSASMSFIVPLSDGSAGRLEARYSWFGRGDDGGGQVSLGFGYLGSF
jgi:hypothetical protein